MQLKGSWAFRGVEPSRAENKKKNLLAYSGFENIKKQPLISTW